MTGSDVAEILGWWRFLGNDEIALQVGIEHALRHAGYEPRREVRLTDRDRIDFVVGFTGIEVKVAGGLGSVERQLRRYADSPAIDGLVLVTTRVQHTQLRTAGLSVPLTIVPIMSGIV